MIQLQQDVKEERKQKIKTTKVINYEVTAIFSSSPLVQLGCSLNPLKLFTRSHESNAARSFNLYLLSLIFCILSRLLSPMDTTLGILSQSHPQDEAAKLAPTLLDLKSRYIFIDYSKIETNQIR